MILINDYKRFDGETDEELIYRICSQKEAIGTWSDVADRLNEALGNSWGESAYRKRFQSFNKVYEGNKNRFSDSESLLAEIQEERRELAKERQKVRDERTEYRRLLREEARKESWLEQLIFAIKEYQTEPLRYDEAKQFTGVLRTDKDMLIPIYDVHTGMNSENFWNTFNEEVLKHRLNKYLDKIFDIQLTNGCENAFVVCSEILSGLIHPTIRLENSQNVIEQFLTAANLISEFLAELSYRFEKVHVYVAPGNHSRVSANKNENPTKENFDNLLLPFLQAKLQNYKNVETHENTIENSIALFSVRGNVVAAVHGDKDSFSSGIAKLAQFLGLTPKIVLMGHLHTNALKTDYNTKIIQTGSISGPDSYCMDKRLNGEPEQLVAVIGESTGLDCLYDINLA